MSIGPVPWRRALVASSVTTSSASSACSPRPHAARVLRTSSRACPSSAGSSAIRQVTQDSPVRVEGMQCSWPWSYRPRAPVVSPFGHRLSCTIPGVPTYGSRSCPAPFIAGSIVDSAAVSTLLATTCCSAGTERKLGVRHCELTASPGGRLARDNQGRQMARHASATPTAGRGSEGRISGYVLKAIRESIGQTQEQLAECLGVSAATVQGWESGRRPLMAMSVGNLMALRADLRRLGAAPALLDALTQGLEADLFVGEVLATPHDQARPGGHLLGGWVVTRPFTEMTAWPIGEAAPHAVAHSTRQALRHGPVPSGPAFGADERRHIVTHLQMVAERADRRTAEGLLLARQAYYLLGFDSSPETTAW